MRLIDAEPLEELLCSRAAQCSDDFGSLAGAVAGCLKLVQAQPVISLPPNPPLTLEELREMDGEPVWVDFENEHGEWALASVSPQSAGVVFLLLKNGIRTPAAIVFECGGNIYRRKPEEGTTWQQ